MGASRFRERAGLYLYGKLRRTDFLPVGEEQEDEVLERGYLSVSSDDEDGNGLEQAYALRSDEDSDSEVSWLGVLVVVEYLPHEAECVHEAS